MICPVSIGRIISGTATPGGSNRIQTARNDTRILHLLADGESRSPKKRVVSGPVPGPKTRGERRIRSGKAPGADPSVGAAHDEMLSVRCEREAADRRSVRRNGHRLEWFGSDRDGSPRTQEPLISAGGLEPSTGNQRKTRRGGGDNGSSTWRARHLTPPGPSIVSPCLMTSPSVMR
jgi:hypothetical protein